MNELDEQQKHPQTISSITSLEKYKDVIVPKGAIHEAKIHDLNSIVALLA
jgi:Tfp pilus assembly PilM family ATPase